MENAHSIPTTMSSPSFGTLPVLIKPQNTTIGPSPPHYRYGYGKYIAGGTIFIILFLLSYFYVELFSISLVSPSTSSSSPLNSQRRDKNQKGFPYPVKGSTGNLSQHDTALNETSSPINPKNQSASSLSPPPPFTSLIPNAILSSSNQAASSVAFAKDSTTTNDDESTVLLHSPSFLTRIRGTPSSSSSSSHLNSADTVGNTNENSGKSQPQKQMPPMSRLAFPQWQILSDRRRGVLRGDVMKSVLHCANAMDAYAEKAVTLKGERGRGRGDRGDSSFTSAVRGDSDRDPLSVDSAASSGHVAEDCEWYHPVVERIVVPEGGAGGDDENESNSNSKNNSPSSSRRSSSSSTLIYSQSALKAHTAYVAALLRNRCGVDIHDKISVKRALNAVRLIDNGDENNAGRSSSLFNASQIIFFRNFLARTVFVESQHQQQQRISSSSLSSSSSFLENNFASIVAAQYNVKLPFDHDIMTKTIRLYHYAGGATGNEVAMVTTMDMLMEMLHHHYGWGSMSRSRSVGGRSSLSSSLKEGALDFLATIEHPLVPLIIPPSPNMSNGSTISDERNASTTTIPSSVMTSTVPIIASLSKTSPAAHHYFKHESANYFGDGLPRLLDFVLKGAVGGNGGEAKNTKGVATTSAAAQLLPPLNVVVDVSYRSPSKKNKNEDQQSPATRSGSGSSSPSSSSSAEGSDKNNDDVNAKSRSKSISPDSMGRRDDAMEQMMLVGGGGGDSNKQKDEGSPKTDSGAVATNISPSGPPSKSRGSNDKTASSPPPRYTARPRFDYWAQYVGDLATIESLRVAMRELKRRGEEDAEKGDTTASSPEETPRESLLVLRERVKQLKILVMEGGLRRDEKEDDGEDEMDGDDEISNSAADDIDDSAEDDVNEDIMVRMHKSQLREKARQEKQLKRLQKRQQNSKQQQQQPRRHFVPPYQPFASGQLAMAATNRLVRLSPSVNDYYGNAMEEGMLSVAREKQRMRRKRRNPFLTSTEEENNQRQRKKHDRLPSTISVPTNTTIASSNPLNQIINTTTAAVRIEGVLRHAPADVKIAAPIDAIAGQWNVSDLPEWLHLPSFTNVGHCLDPKSSSSASASLTTPSSTSKTRKEKKRKSILVIGPSHSRNLYRSLCNTYMLSKHRNAAASQGAAAGTADQKVLIKGKPTVDDNVVIPAESVGHYCMKNTIVPRRLVPHDYSDDDEDLTREEEGGSSSGHRSPPSPAAVDQPFAIAFGWHTMNAFVSIENTARDLLNALAKEPPPQQRTQQGQGQVHQQQPSSSHSLPPPPMVRFKNDASGIAKAYAKHLPYFADSAVMLGKQLRELRNNRNQTPTDAANSLTPPSAFPSSSSDSSSSSLFSLRRFLTRHNATELTKLRGLFTHVVFNPGVWDANFMDATLPEHTEATALALDLIEEVFAPTEKIVVYNPHTFHSSEYPPQYNDPMGEWFDQKEAELPSVSGMVSDKHACNTRYRSAKVRDANLAATHVGTRDRVRTAWMRRFHKMAGIDSSYFYATSTNVTTRNTIQTARRVGDPHLSALMMNMIRRATVQVFDPLVMTTQLAHFFVDRPGHHYKEVVIEAIGQRLLRDYVCPPRYALAIRPTEQAYTPSSSSSSETTSADISEPSTQNSGASSSSFRVDHPFVNYASSRLPTRFPFPEGVDTVFIRIAEEDGTSGEVGMPYLSYSSRSSCGGEVCTDDAKKNIFSSSNITTYLIHNLFPLTKAPLLDVLEGMQRAIFDHPYSDMGRLTGGQRRRKKIEMISGAAAGGTGDDDEEGIEQEDDSQGAHGDDDSRNININTMHRAVPRRMSYGLQLPPGESAWWEEVARRAVATSKGFHRSDEEDYFHDSSSPTLLVPSNGASNTTTIQSPPRPRQPPIPSNLVNNGLILGSMNPLNPYMVCPLCATRRSTRLMKKGTLAALLATATTTAAASKTGVGTDGEQAMLDGDDDHHVDNELSVLEGGLAIVHQKQQRGNSSSSSRSNSDNPIRPITPGDPIHRHMSFPLYTTARHSVDAAYLLRTFDYSGLSVETNTDSCLWTGAIPNRWGSGKGIVMYRDPRSGKVLKRAAPLPITSSLFIGPNLPFFVSSSIVSKLKQKAAGATTMADAIPPTSGSVNQTIVSLTTATTASPPPRQRAAPPLKRKGSPSISPSAHNRQPQQQQKDEDAYAFFEVYGKQKLESHVDGCTVPLGNELYARMLAMVYIAERSEP